MFTQRLAHQLTEQGNRVVVVTSRLSPDAPSHETQEDGVEVYRLPCWSFLDGRLPISHRNREYEAMLSEIAELGIDRILVNVRFLSQFPPRAWRFCAGCIGCSRHCARSLALLI